MHKTKSKKALSITLHTVRQLSAIDLGTAAGAGSVLIRCGITRTCPGVCVSMTDDTCPTVIK
ncbi:MAG: hypothetical protein K8W52_35795 [Deltaproteobacteria bacterium]|nr:hypothetical protein [Deltaproteobacteria bacterium]